LRFQESSFECFIDESLQITKVILNDADITKMYANVRLFVQPANIFPEVIAHFRSPDEQNTSSYLRQDLPLVDHLSKTLTPFLDKRLTISKINELASLILAMPDFTDENLRTCQERGPGTFQRLIRDVQGKDSRKLRNQLRTIFLANRMPSALTACFRRLREIVLRTLYIGPVRARSERYYRYQDLAVSEIDSDGKNFPMFLNSLTNSQKDRFSDWVKSRFGYGVKVSHDQGHISISLSANERVTNIVDTGYGVSQILPVLGQIWWAANRGSIRDLRRTPSATVLLIEQPELHLHPAHQALIADALAGQQGGSNRFPGHVPVQFVIETHSEALVNRIGQLIAEGRVSPTDAQVLLFDADPKDERATIVSIASFDTEGALLNWPYGFFQPDLAK
jgi:hypothetical protein